MSTTRAGDPTATQAPSVPPTPGTVPTQTLPADGDALTAASIAQALKVIADFEAWSKSPRAQAAAGTGASNWAEAILLWKNARLQSRFAIDHLGFPGGKFVQWQEDWGGKPPASISTGLGLELINNWLVSAELTSGSCVQKGPNLNELRAVAMRMTVGSSANDMTRVYKRFIPMTADADTSMVMQWDFCPHSGTVANHEYAGGMFDSVYVVAATSSALSVVEPKGCGFVKRTGDANWQIYTKVSGSPTYTTTGVAVASTTPVRFRVETVGANTGDDSTARALFYVNGVFKASIAVATVATPVPMFSISNPGGGAGELDVGPVDFRANIWPGSLIF